MMSSVAIRIAKMIDMLPESEQLFAEEFVKRLVLAWDPDFTKVTPEEAEKIKEAEASGFISEDEIDWNDLGKYAEN